MTESKTLSAINNDGQLNVLVIQQEIARDIAMDNQYHAEDDMKKKAIHMSKNYDEFKSFVACSNLQPVQRNEMSQLFMPREYNNSLMKQTRPNKLSNSFSELDQATKKLLNGLRISSNENQDASIIPIVSAARNRTNSITNSLSLTNVPSTFLELEKQWRYYCTSVESTLQYILLSTDVTENHDDNNSMVKYPLFIPTSLRLCPEYVCCKLCKMEMSSEMFGDLIAALFHLLKDSTTYEIETSTVVEKNHEIIQSCILFAYKWIKCLPKSGGFDLNIAFLNQKQKQFVVSIFQLLVERFWAQSTVYDQRNVSVSSSLTDDRKSFMELEQLYKVKVLLY